VDDDGTALGLTPEDMEKSIANLTKMARNLNADVSVLCERQGKEGKVCELLVRYTAKKWPQNLFKKGSLERTGT
jgi:GTPase